MEQFRLDCFDAALCLLPPRDLWGPLDRLRELYDSAFGKWPPHINLVYPFVQIQSLEDAVAAIASHLKEAGHGRLEIALNSAGRFTHGPQSTSTVFRTDDDEERASGLGSFQDSLFAALGTAPTRPQRPHLTVAKTCGDDESGFVLQKAGFLPAAQWWATKVTVLVRTRTDSGSAEMRVWGTIGLDGSVDKHTDADAFPLPRNSAAGPESQPAPAYRFSDRLGIWAPWEQDQPDPPAPDSGAFHGPGMLVVASYNVLAEFCWPPDRTRYPQLITNLLADNARADILALQEVTDDFLLALLRDPLIRSLYPYATHAPPDQHDAEPFPSLLNVVVLSRLPFSWKMLRFKRRHKGSPTLEFPTGAGNGETGARSLVFVACHLTKGLTDGAIAAKKNELACILNHLRSLPSEVPCVVAGDFNLVSSVHTIDSALKRGAISNQTERLLEGFHTVISESGFQDAWLLARCEVGESSSIRGNYRLLDRFEGEQGATFDPLDNGRASISVGSGLNNRPQRYDRILARLADVFWVKGFNMFGHSSAEGSLPASDHWGIRCLLELGGPSETPAGLPATVSVDMKRAPPGLADVEAMKDSIRQVGGWPEEQDAATRAAAVRLLQEVILEQEKRGHDSTPREAGRPALVLVPVGSYGLGVWSPTSDIDCLCIGPYSQATFFTIAIRNLKCAGPKGIRIMRRVKANSGTMLELDVLGVKVDLQYCAATAISESWPDVMRRPATDPVFSLPQQSLAKLKPARDMFYILRSVPDLVQFQAAYLALKAWAKERGIYTAKFGYLGGINITVMLVRICKILTRGGEAFSAADVVTTFFDHYADFDWGARLVFDPFFHRTLRYTRTFREPVCLLGWHGPHLNTALAASGPTVDTITAELRRARQMVQGGGVSWADLVGRGTARPGAIGAVEFLTSYRSYVRIDVGYWGPSPQKGRMLVGWLESRCASVLVDLHRQAPHISARFWPARFGSPSGSEVEELDGYQVCYLIGLAWNDGNSSAPSARTADDARSTEGVLGALLHRFEQRIRGDAKYYDEKYCFVGATIVRSAELGNLVLNSESCGDYDTGEDEPDSDDADEWDADDIVLQPPLSETGQGPYGEGVPKSARNAPSPAKLPATATLRSAHDVLNRIRWDDSMDSSDYAVGYEDRFSGAMEKPLELWKNDQTEEDFIPQHRIIYFKRVSDGTVVWDRRARRDEIFGSGIRRK